MNKTKKENLIFIDGWEHVHCPVCGTLVQKRKWLIKGKTT